VTFQTRNESLTLMSHTGKYIQVVCLPGRLYIHQVHKTWSTWQFFKCLQKWLPLHFVRPVRGWFRRFCTVSIIPQRNSAICKSHAAVSLLFRLKATIR
jgi:hypothetical protein